MRTIPVADIAERCRTLTAAPSFANGLVVKLMAASAPNSSSQGEQNQLALSMCRSVSANIIALSLAHYMTERFVHEHGSYLGCRDPSGSVYHLGSQILMPAENRQFSIVSFSDARAGDQNAASPLDRARQTIVDRWLEPICWPPDGPWERIERRDNAYAFLNTRNWTMRPREQFLQYEDPASTPSFESALERRAFSLLVVDLDEVPLDEDLTALLSDGVAGNHFGGRSFEDRLEKARMFLSNPLGAPPKMGELASFLKLSTSSQKFKDIRDKMKNEGFVLRGRGRPKNN